MKNGSHNSSYPNQVQTGLLPVARGLLNKPENVGDFGSDKNLAALAHAYLDAEIVGIKSPLTLKAKVQDLKKFLAFFQATNGHLNTTTWLPRDTKLFIEVLAREQYAAATSNRVLATLKSFVKWLASKGAVQLDPCRGVHEIQVMPSPPKWINDLDYHRLRKSADFLASRNVHAHSQGVRDRALLEVLNSSGLRIAEILNLRASQLHGRCLRQVLCKGNRVRDVLITKEAAGLLHDYLTQRLAGAGFLFLNRDGEQLSRNGAANALNKIAAQASVSLPDEEKIRLHPHRLRHRHAKKARDRMGDIFAQKRLGHTSGRYLERYTRLSEKEEEEIIETL